MDDVVSPYSRMTLARVWPVTGQARVANVGPVGIFKWESQKKSSDLECEINSKDSGNVPSGLPG